MDKTAQRTSYLSEHIPQEDNQPQIVNHSERVILHVVEYIVSNAEKIGKEHLLLKKYLNSFSNQKTINNINEVNNLFFSMGGNKEKQDKQQAEPIPLLIDSLLPISADIDAENAYKKSQRKINVFQQSSIKFKMSKPALTERDDKYRKLDITQTSEQDPMTKQMRRLSQQKGAKQSKEKKEKQKLDKIKIKQKGGKDQKVSYDYNGKTIEIKINSKANLISSLIDGNTHSKTEVIKEAINDPNPTTLEGQSPNKAKGKKIEIPTQNSKKRDQIQFSNVKSLADQYKTTYGVKYIYEGKTYEQKKGLISTRDLQRTLSQRKLSKQQFEKIKKMNMNNRQQFEQSLKKSTLKSTSEIKHLRTHSQIKQIEIKQKKRFETIHVNNVTLKNKLLEKVIKVEEPPQKEQNQEEKQTMSKIRLDSIDTFNMEYIKTGGTLKSNTSQEFFLDNNKLPKISHTTIYTHTKPKGRERIKDSNQILRDLRKRFEEKLRV